MQPQARAGSSPSGDIEPLARLGVGGMGEVLLARRRGAAGFEKLIAVKTIRSDLSRNDEIRRMFTDEARLLARLDHPSVAQVHHLGEQNGVLYLAMEYVPGMALGTILKRRPGPFPAAVAAQIGAEVCRGLHAAHELADLAGQPLGVVHRDVSPQNLMLTFDGRMKILDFGVAFVRDREAATTGAGIVKGKLAYLAPEQIHGEEVDRRADLYGLGVVMHELLTGKRLFGKGESPLADALQRRKVAKPSSTNKDVPSELDAIVMRVLSKSPSDRYDDAREMGAALDAFARKVGGESLEAYAHRELAEDREKHRAWLQKIQATPDSITIRDAPELSTRQERGSKSGTIDIDEDFPTEPPSRSSRVAVLLLVLAILAGVAHYSDPTLVPRAVAELQRRGVPVPFGRSPVDSPPADLARSDTPPPAELPATTATKAEAIAVVDPVPPPTAWVPTATAGSIADPTPPLSALVASPPPPAVPPELEDTVASESEEDESAEEPAAETPPIPPLPSPTPATRAPLVTKTKPAPLPKPKTTKPKPASRPGYGSLSLEARSGGTVYVDGKRVGSTPLSNHRLKVGRHTVALRRQGDKTPRWTTTVNVRDAKLIRIVLR